ncbi:MAG: hypothetical protein NZ772_13555, partial [Cyanobacteria bacterium]|nr:hypothetical protein [Cyanobacteriota bacterium]
MAHNPFPTVAEHYQNFKRDYANYCYDFDFVPDGLRFLSPPWNLLFIRWTNYCLAADVAFEQAWPLG